MKYNYSPNVDNLLSKILELNSKHTSMIAESMKQLSNDELQDFDHYIEYLQMNGRTLDSLAKDYTLIVTDTFKELIYFSRFGHYRFSTIKEIEEAGYFDKKYMDQYMIGLGLTTFVWENHMQMKRFFTKNLPTNQMGTYLEIGPGHGFNMMQAIKNTNCQHYIGVDINEASVDLTRKILASTCFGKFNNYQVVKSDFLQWKSNKLYDIIVMGEVLEHVENPLSFLRKIKQLASDSAHIFVTTCINAPAIDHISLYKSFEDIELLIEHAGLEIKQCLQIPYHKKSLLECQKEKLPVNVGVIL